MTSTPTQPIEISSKTTKIQDYFRMQIRKGLLVAGDRLPPERQLASTFGVSLLTVNKAMANLESKMLLERQTSRGTYIHPTVSRGQILVVFSTEHFANPELAGFFQSLLEKLASTVKSHGMRPTQILGHGATSDKFIESLEPHSTIWQQAAGVIATGGLEDFEDQLAQISVPVVTLTTVRNQGHHHVIIDLNDLIIKSYRHLVNRGCQRIALITNIEMQGRRFTPDSQGQNYCEPDLLEHLNSIYFKSLNGNGPNIAQSYIKSSCRTPAQGYQAMCELWENNNRPDGVIISDDNTAIGIAQAVRDLNIKTPSELKLITQATAGVPRDFPLNYTRYQFDLSRICRGAIGLLYRLMLQEREANSLTLKATLCQGSTT